MVAVLERILGRTVVGTHATAAPRVTVEKQAAPFMVGEFRADYSELSFEEIEAEVPGMEALLRNSVKVSSNQGL